MLPHPKPLARLAGYDPLSLRWTLHPPSQPPSIAITTLQFVCQTILRFTLASNTSTSSTNSSGTRWKTESSLFLAFLRSTMLPIFLPSLCLVFSLKNFAQSLCILDCHSFSTCNLSYVPMFSTFSHHLFHSRLEMRGSIGGSPPQARYPLLG